MKFDHQNYVRKEIPELESLSSLNKEKAWELYRFMLALRRCEEEIIRVYHIDNDMKCPVHFCIGQEAVAAALSIEIKNLDYLFSHHRTHSYFFSKGGSLKEFLGELHGRRCGANGGVAGSMDLSLPRVNFYGGAIMTGALAIGVGCAHGLKHQGSSSVVVAAIGEAATEEGVFWEAINYAQLKKLPIIFICENNRYSIYSDQKDRQVDVDLANRVRSFHLRSHVVFGNDVAALHQVLSKEINLIRSGEGPCFIEAMTYRINSHVGPENDDNVEYRVHNEIDWWKTQCPIHLLENRLKSNGWWDENYKTQLDTKIKKELQEAFLEVKKSPFPESADWHKLNFSDESPLADSLLEDCEEGSFNQNQKDAIPGPY